jgi:hypothetical protein
VFIRVIVFSSFNEIRSGEVPLNVMREVRQDGQGIEAEQQSEDRDEE